MSEPVCRTCHFISLSDGQKERFMAEPQIMPAHYCPRHQKQQDAMDAALRKIKVHSTVTGRMNRRGETVPEFPRYRA